MRIPLNKTLTARVFERVETVDPQYHVYDFGVEHANGGIDSIAAGGSFHSARNAYASWTTKCQEQEASTKKDASVKAKTAAQPSVAEPEFSDDDEVIED